MTLLSTLLSDLVAILQSAKAKDIRDPKYTARVIIAHTCHLDRAAQLANPDQKIASDMADRARSMATRHAHGEPLSRIRGHAHFYDLDFELSKETLDPRPETEIIVRVALQFILSLKGGAVAPEDDGRGNVSLLDLGTGTGCIPIALLKHASHLHATAVDISNDALQTARRNAIIHGVNNRMTIIQSNWYEALEQECRPGAGQDLVGLNQSGSRPGQARQINFDIITSNPPYIRTDDIANLDENVRRYDPIRALDGGPTGLDPYDILFAGLDTHLAPRGIALFEIGIGQAPDIMLLADKYGLDVHPPIMDDAKIPRVICVTRPPKNKVDSGA
jgi:release factor glutamine methyltransferase